MKLISNLPKDIRELAELRRSEQPELLEIFKGNPDDLCDAFGWGETPEGEDFWEEIDNGNYQPFYDKYPNHEWRQPEKETILTLSEATQILSDKLGKKVRIDTAK